MRLYDTLSGEKRDFTPRSDEVTMYVCGPNLYGPCHIGHALSYLFFDVLRRYLEYKGHRVRQVQNFTDIEDRIIQVAQDDGTTIGALAEQYIARFLEEMTALGVQPAHEYPRATDYIDRMIQIIADLIERGHAYEVEGDVYFRVRGFESYGRLSRRPMEEMRAGSRIEIDPRKEDPMDFALWKVSKEGEPSWPTPWGPGRPGWHIECTAMSLSLLGDQIDIHGGGQDVIFPHHENEIAQSETYTGLSPFVRFWVHNGLLRLSEDDTEKMSRHVGNIISCRDALAQHSPDTLRLYFFSSHYRSPLTYSEEGVAAADRALERLRNALRPAPEGETGDSVDADAFRDRFTSAMDDDLNTPQAVAALFDLAREINRQREAGRSVSSAQATLRQLASVLGLTLSDPADDERKDAHPFIDLLVETRSRLRAERNFQLGDSIRDQLDELGVTLEDSPDGTKWRFKSLR
ncbi:MAG: cysteine--tRNA ligase [Chloroflexota bacterium]|nr:cysteine--tRNA ligase [Chloroflexota bacterium]MDE2942382.1 cysteine--tRNA ligase [Chloroflexota bacterium]MDE3267938.1 cysteine--tRNA ligase [Chloroflexota bacterium]